jgi:multidrug resistance efflux pump
MTGMKALRTLPWVFGGCLVVASSVGANRLLHPTDGQPPAGGDGGPGRPAVTAGGVIILGHVDSDPPPIPVGPPGLAMSAAVTKVLVKEGQEVQPGTPLVQFDDAMYQAKLRQAKAELEAAKADLTKAERAVQIHARQVEAQKSVVKSTEAQLRDAEDLLQAGKDKFERILAAERNLSTGQPLTESDKAQRRRENEDLRKGEMAVNQLRAQLDGEKAKLDILTMTPVAEDVKRAQAKVAGTEGAVAEAQAAIDASLRKAEVAGVVQQVAAAPGMTFGPSTRAPLVYLIPAGPRVIRAEAEPEFAARVAGSEGKRVTVYDSYNFALTYTGTVRHISPAFLPKRSSADALSVNGPNRVLEVLIDVADPAPPGKPPLRVGQPVRVAFQ